ncbi:hypothetical protein AJ79_01403 [Helicocarpus griseus UAMH5409]|uniref:Uncharacterized protein n=1 Tax=Helicocarpus griseus UAMH5409 TaxID=1447875 RepID=A0A2B7Y7E4_9EURO|nr:hypothetical protein AJ79_01403 [Helicocarpus griseus UAMH5409]
MGQLLENQVSPRSQPLRLAPPRFGQTPRFDPAIHQSPVEEDLMNEDEDSFLQTIISRSPSKLNGSDKWPNTPTESMASMSLQSPARSYKDIEDPLDAIDALEDALEQIGQALPVIEDRGLDSPVRAGTPTNGAPQSRPHGAPEAHLSRVQSNGTEPATRKRTVSFHRLRDGIEQKPQPREANPSNTPSNPAITRQSSLTTARTANGPVRSVSKTARPASNDASSTSIQPSMVRKGSHPNLSSNTASTTVSKASKPRPQSTVISTSKPGFTPSKSTKPPTRPTFELPGEAISRQRRAQREERLKREEEELQRKREFKARKPRHLSSTPSLPVKDTATSRSRATLKADEPGSPGNPSILQNGRSSSLMPGRTSSFRTPSTSSRTSNPTQPNNASTVKKSTSVSPATPAKPTTLNGTSRRLSSNESRTPKSCSRAESTPASSRTPATTNTARTDDNTLPVQRSRGKEIFTRERIHERERERERREKEEAAKRARVEAAERGRLASREWAERQKARMAARKSRSHPDLKAEEGS